MWPGLRGRRIVLFELVWVIVLIFFFLFLDNFSGFVINTCGWIDGAGYKCLLLTAEAFKGMYTYYNILDDIKRRKIVIVNYFWWYVFFVKHMLPNYFLFLFS